MTRVAILAEKTGGGDVVYRAIAGEEQSLGRTAGEALDALTPRLTASDDGTLIIVQNLRPDSLFTADQQERLQQLMTQWRDCQAKGLTMPNEKQDELDHLVQTELKAATQRAISLIGKLQP